MNIVIAADSFKGCMSSEQAAESIAEGILRANPNHSIQKFPAADGGEGTAEVFARLMKSPLVHVPTLNSAGRTIDASYAFDPKTKTAVMDAASCIGLNRTPKESRNPMIGTSRGLGRMMQDAICRGCQKLIIGLGGTGTNDGGMGLLTEFGVTFYDEDREVLPPNPYSLSRIAFIDKRKVTLPRDVEIIVACDVKNYLLGPQGATFVFGPQKGLYKTQLPLVEQGMAHYRDKMLQTFHVDINSFEGGGAAGGIGSVLLAIFKAKKASGIDLMMEYSGMETAIAQADLVITGEGQTDLQTMFGKVPFGVASMARRYNKPCLCLSGALGPGYEKLYEAGATGIFSTCDRAMSFETAIACGPRKLTELTTSVIRLIDAISERKTYETEK